MSLVGVSVIGTRTTFPLTTAVVVSVSVIVPAGGSGIFMSYDVVRKHECRHRSHDGHDGEYGHDFPSLGQCSAFAIWFPERVLWRECRPSELESTVA